MISNRQAIHLRADIDPRLFLTHLPVILSNSIGTPVRSPVIGDGCSFRRE